MAEGRPRTDVEKRKAVLNELIILQHKFYSLEREKNNQLYGKGHEFRSLFCSLEEFELHLSKERNVEKKNLKQQINQIRSNVTHFKRILQSGNTTSPSCKKESFVEKIKETLEEIEASIEIFKEKQKNVYEQLLREERIVWQEVQAYEKRIEAWTTSRSANTVVDQKSSNQDITDNSAKQPPAVMQFEVFLQQTGGYNGGWDTYDHQTFLKIRNRFHGKACFIDEITKEIPTHSQDEIQQHEEWYDKYLILLESKRKAIADWKRERKEKKVYSLLKEQKQASKDKGVLSNHQKLLERERQERFSRLSEWKETQHRKQYETEERKRQLEKDLIKKNNREKEKQAKVKEKVQEYARIKEKERQMKMLDKQLKDAVSKEQAILANKRIQEYQLRDTEALREKQNQLMIKECEQKEQQMRLERLKKKVSVTATHDPQRLLRPTIGWEERQKAGQGSGIGGPMTSLPKRAVPTWRQGLS